MHYGRAYFSKNKSIPLETIVPKDPSASIGQRVGLSVTDIVELNIYFGCNSIDGGEGRNVEFY